MADTSEDPVDHSRTHMPRAGESMKDARALPGYVAIGLAVAALCGCLGASAVGNVVWAVALGAIALVLAVAGGVWVYSEHRRIARIAAPRIAEQQR